MTEQLSLAERLEHATSSAAQSWIITEMLLQAYPAAIRESVVAAAVPHWFNAEILALLLGLNEEIANTRYSELQQLSIVQPFGSLGHALHDLTRSGILQHLATEERDKLLQWSEKLQTYFQDSNDPQQEVEQIYHLLIIDPEKGRSHLKLRSRFWRSRGDFAVVENLLRNYNELIALDLLAATDRNELEQQEYRLTESLVNRAKRDSSDEGDQYLRNVLERFTLPDKLTDLLANEPVHLREQIDTYRQDFVQGKIEAARSIGDLQQQPFWMAELGDIYHDQGNVAEALRQLDDAIQLNPNNQLALIYRAGVYRGEKRYEEALVDLDRVIAFDAQDEWAIANRGLTYRSMERYEEALADFDRVIALDEKMAWAVASRGHLYQSMKRYEEALADFDRAIALDEKYAWAITNRGHLYQSLERYEEALADFDRAIELDEKDAWAITSRAQLYQSLEQYEEALADFTHAINVDEKYTWAIVSRGNLYVLLGKYEEAIADFDRIIDSDSEQVGALFQRGEIYLLFGQNDKALIDINRVITIDDQRSWAIGRRSLINRRLGRHDEALVDIERALEVEELEQRRTWYLYCRGLQLLIEGKQDLAAKDFDHAIELSESEYSKAPEEETNRFNLMLYALAVEDEARVKELLPDILENADSIHFLRMAIFLVSDLLSIFPDHTQAINVLQQLETRAQHFVSFKR